VPTAGWPADFYWRNINFVSNVFEAAARTGVKRVVYTMGGCSYPATATRRSAKIDVGWLSAARTRRYSTAKKMGIVAADAYRTQHGISSTVLVPGNAVRRVRQLPQWREPCDPGLSAPLP
jgi:GDP-L-fucose synthase